MEIQIWSDFACPWCALGFTRLDVALEQFEHADDVTAGAPLLRARSIGAAPP